MLPRPSSLPAGFIAPCLPINAPQPPSGEQWPHEIKHDGFRIIARKDSKRVKLYSRPGNDLTYRFPLIVEAIAKLRSRSCIIDGEAVACGEDGIASFDRIRYRRHDADVFMWSFCPSCISFDSAFLEGAFLFFATRMSASSQNRVLCHRSPLPVPCERTRRAALGRPSSQRAF
jgi:ATP-dependent DNA ligase